MNIRVGINNAYTNGLHPVFICLARTFLFFIERKEEREINLLFHLCMHSLVASCLCLDQRSNLQPWFIKTTP